MPQGRFRVFDPTLRDEFLEKRTNSSQKPPTLLGWRTMRPDDYFAVASSEGGVVLSMLTLGHLVLEGVSPEVFEPGKPEVLLVLNAQKVITPDREMTGSAIVVTSEVHGHMSIEVISARGRHYPYLHSTGDKPAIWNPG